jgi:lipopolysaccharide export system protein LptA
MKTRKANNPILCAAALLALAVACAVAQNSAIESPLKNPASEADLLKKIEGLEPAKKPVEEKPEKKDKGPTEITSDQATFQNKAHTAVFIGNVSVKDPEFNVTCDKLTAFLKNNDSKPADNGKPAVKPVANPEAKAGDNKKGGLDRAIAEGNVYINQDKVEADGSITKCIGRAKRADYDAKTGNIVLSGKPVVKQGMNMCIATSEETVMTLNRDRNMEVKGPNRVIITDKGDLEKP